MVDTEHSVTYNGFIYVKHKGDEKIGLAQVRECARLLSKPKKAQELHPLFARGFATKLTLKILDDALRVYVNETSSSDRLVVMDHPVYKIVFVVNDEKDVYVVARHDLRGKGTMFKCHGFRCEKASQAKKLSNDIAKVCSSAIEKIKKTREFVRNNSGRDVPAKPKATSASNGVKFRPTRRKKDDTDAVLLKRYIAQARMTIMMGSADDDDVPDVTEVEEQKVDKTMSYEDDEMNDDQLRTLRDELKLAVSAVSPLDEPSSATHEGDIGFDWDDTFDDDFARMTLFVHSDGKQPEIPRYADITLDSAIFECSTEV